MALLGLFCLQPYAAGRFEPISMEVHQTETLEGCSPDLATAPRIYFRNIIEDIYVLAGKDALLRQLAFHLASRVLNYS